MSAVVEDLRGALISAFRTGLGELDPALLVERTLAAANATGGDPAAPTLRSARVTAHGKAPRSRVVVVAAGKAALGMSRGALRAWGDRIETGLAVTVDALDPPPSDQAEEP